MDTFPPAVTPLDQQGASIQPGGATNGKGITFNADDRRVGGGGDPPIVSGLVKFEVWRGDPSAGGTLLASNSDPFGTDHIYTKNDPGLAVLDQLPEGEFFARAIDGAGNDTSVHIKSVLV